MERISDKEFYEFLAEVYLQPCEPEYGPYYPETKTMRVKTLYTTIRKRYPELYELTLRDFAKGFINHCGLELYHPEGYWGKPDLDSLHIRGRMARVAPRAVFDIIKIKCCAHKETFRRVLPKHPGIYKDDKVKHKPKGCESRVRGVYIEENLYDTTMIDTRERDPVTAELLEPMTLREYVDRWVQGTSNKKNMTTVI